MKLIKCNICGSDKFKVLFKNKDRIYKTGEKEFNITKCENCGLVCINPQPTPEEIKKYYSRNYRPHQNKNSLKSNKFFLSLKNFLKKEKKREILKEEKKIFLDFGCGSGEQLERIRNKHPSWELYGLDIYKEPCERTREKGFKVFCGEISKLNLKENFFDIVNMKHTIEHLHDPKKTLLFINKILKPKGDLIITTPNFDSVASKLFRKYWYALDTPRHLYLFTPSTIAKLLELTGFEIKKIEFVKDCVIGIRSFYLLLQKKDLTVSPFFSFVLKPLGKFLARYKKTSVMIIHAKKLHSIPFDL